MNTKFRLSIMLMATPIVTNSELNAQICSSCNLLISSVQTTPITVTAGETLCISGTGQMNATLYISGGSVCNQGVINGNVDMTNGNFINNGTISSNASIMVDRGNFTNNNYIDAGNVQFNGANIVVANNGDFYATNFQFLKNQLGSTSVFSNNGNMEVSSFMMDSSDFQNYGSLLCSGLFSNLEAASFFNYSVLEVGQNFTNKGYFYTDCMIPVGGLWANNVPGIIVGPVSGCGGFITTQSTSNFSQFGADGSFLDMCDSSNVGSFNFNIGTIGPNVSYCNCTNLCSTTVLSTPQSDFAFSIYPNPAETSLFIKHDPSMVGQVFSIFNSLGQLVKEGYLENNLTQIDISQLAKGTYIIQSGGRSNMFFK